MSYSAAADYLSRSKPKIEKSWLVRVQDSIPETHGKSTKLMMDSLGVLIDELILELENENVSPGAFSDKAMSKVHGAERAALSGYNIPQLLKEFSILREILNEEFHAHGVLTFEVRAVIDKAIDYVISKAAEEFVAVQSKTTKIALDIAEKSNRDLEQFASIAAHDLKAPLATISGYLEVLEENFLKNQSADDSLSYISTMKQTSQRMLDLVDRLLDLAKILHSNKPFKLVNLNHALKASLQNLSAFVNTHSAIIQYEDLPSVMGDIYLLTQLFQNLIANGIKFHGPQKPRIYISGRETKDAWVISVKDNGIGFNPKQKEDIFSLYKTLHSQNEYKGTGIGLATCRKVMELHGGTIWADSNPGRGSIFSFAFPKNQERYH